MASGANGLNVVTMLKRISLVVMVMSCNSAALST